MKVLIYTICNKVKIGAEEAPVLEEIFYPVKMSWSEANEEIAKKEAYNGEYTIEDDGQPEHKPTEAVDDVLNALLGVYE